MSFAKTPQQLNVIHVTCYTTSSYVIHFKCVPNFGEGQEQKGRRVEIVGIAADADSLAKRSRSDCPRPVLPQGTVCLRVPSLCGA
jgi:hypothetical protein